MKTVLSPEQAGAIAGEHFGDQYHCAEAVVAAGLHALGEYETQQAIAHATAFGGGFGKSFSQSCGVLSGCMLVIGHFHGRKQAGESWHIPAELGAQIVREFEQQYGTCNCGVLRERFGEEKQMDECRKLVMTATAKLVNLLRCEKELDNDLSER